MKQIFTLPFYSVLFLFGCESVDSLRRLFLGYAKVKEVLSHAEDIHEMEIGGREGERMEERIMHSLAMIAITQSPRVMSIYLAPVGKFGLSFISLFSCGANMKCKSQHNQPGVVWATVAIWYRPALRCSQQIGDVQLRTNSNPPPEEFSMSAGMIGRGPSSAVRLVMTRTCRTRKHLGDSRVLHRHPHFQLYAGLEPWAKPGWATRRGMLECQMEFMTLRWSFG
ncbi:hypothetical protein B0J18DRAFT_49300 [Chaetomium sp. MPI-SDFR-AT-0129]|nr:hypothetical protein B0J18DRAFT_49300 [Chaetomium sp. MPI-SDFR-AT-0129]